MKEGRSMQLQLVDIYKYFGEADSRTAALRGVSCTIQAGSITVLLGPSGSGKSTLLNIIGGINWGSVGLFRFDLVAWICGGQTAIVARVIYTLVGLAALWCISLLFRTDAVNDEI